MTTRNPSAVLIVRSVAAVFFFPPVGFIAAVAAVVWWRAWKRSQANRRLRAAWVHWLAFWLAVLIWTVWMALFAYSSLQ